MENNYQNADALISNDYEQKVLPSGLNILTILTFVWSGLSAIFSIIAFFTAKKTYETKDKMLEQMNSPSMPKFMKSFMPDMTHYEEMVTKNYENRIPILLLTLVGIALCIIGAIQMRKAMKQGFWLYTVGELMPILVSVLFIGVFTLTNIGSYFMIFIAILFITLYYFQRKYLTK